MFNLVVSVGVGVRVGVRVITKALLIWYEHSQIVSVWSQEAKTGCLLKRTLHPHFVAAPKGVQAPMNEVKRTVPSLPPPVADTGGSNMARSRGVIAVFVTGHISRSPLANDP
jgi:hypothetical protein